MIVNQIILNERKNNGAKFELLAVKKGDHQVGSDLQYVCIAFLAVPNVLQFLNQFSNSQFSAKINKRLSKFIFIHTN